MATVIPILGEEGPSLDEILAPHGLKVTDLDRECPQSVRNEIAVKLDNWEMVGRCLEFSLEKLRDINRENASQELCTTALLDTWGKRDGPRATYLKLAGVLHHRQRCDLVDLLCAKLKSTLSLVSLSGSVTTRKVPPGNGKEHQNSSVFQEFIEAFGQMGRTFFQAERIVDGRTLHQRKGISRTSSVPGPVSVHVKNPLQQRYASNDAVYSLVVSVTSSRSRVYEVYIDAYLHNTALKILKLRRQLEIHGKDITEFDIKAFRYDFTASSDPFLKLILPEENPYIIAVEPEDGMIRVSDIWRESEHDNLQHHLEDYHLKITIKGTKFDPPTIKFKGSTDDSKLDIHLRFHVIACPYVPQKRMYVMKEKLIRRVQDPLSKSATTNFMPNKDIQFGFHNASGRQIRITNNGLAAEKRNADKGYMNGVAYGACPLKGRAEFEVMIVTYGTKWSWSALRFGVMRCEEGERIESGPSIPGEMFSAVNRFIWSGEHVHNNLVTPSECFKYGYVDLRDLREGDCIGLYLSQDGVLEFFVNGESQGIASENIYTRNTDVYAVVDHYSSCFATVITKAVTEYGETCINLQELCLERLSSWLKSGDEVDRLPLPTRLKHKLKWYLDE